MDIKQLIRNKDFSGLDQALSEDPDLANEGLPYDEFNTTKAHPLHRLADAVFVGQLSGEASVELGELFLKHGAMVNGNTLVEGKDTPLIAASSLHADLLAFLLIEKGADIRHAGTHGGTALHWAAWCGRDKVVKRLLEEGAGVNTLCTDFKSTPLFWGIHGFKRGNKTAEERQAYLACVRHLVAAGASKQLPNLEGETIYDLLGAEDADFRDALA